MGKNFTNSRPHQKSIKMPGGETGAKVAQRLIVVDHMIFSITANVS